jgi:predicted nucleic acid-binding protein
MAVLDTNVLLRYLTQDEPDQSQHALDLLRKLESGERTAALPQAVLVETVQVLSSPRLYAVSRQVIGTRLAEVLRLRGVRLPGKRTYLQALDLYVQYGRLSFVDALLAAHAQRERDTTVISFDADFRNLPGVISEQP